MGATFRRRGKRSWLVTVHHAGRREFQTVRSEQDARDLVKLVHKQELAGINVIETVRAARETPPITPMKWPSLREALPDFIDHMAAHGEWTGSTPLTYRRRLATYVYGFALPDGQQLGDVPVNRVTEQMIGAVLDAIRSTGPDRARKPKSLAVQEQIRSPLKRFYRNLIRKHGSRGRIPPRTSRIT